MNTPAATTAPGPAAQGTRNLMSQQLLLDILPPSAPTLDNFVPGPNAAAVQALRQCGPGRAIYVWGAPGAGKSHLLQAMAGTQGGRYFAGHTPAATLLRLATGEAPVPACVAIDDITALAPAAQAAVFTLYNRWREQQATPHAFALLVAGPQAPLALPVREDLRTRLGWDLVFRLEQLSDAERAHALHTRAAERGLQLSPDVINWVLTHYDRHMGKLTALIDALDRYSLEKHRAITLPLLKDLLARSQPPNSSNTTHT